MKTETKQRIEKLTSLEQMDLTNIYRTFPPKTKEHTFFSAPHGIFSKINHIINPSQNRPQQIQEDGNNPMHSIRSPQTKVGLQ